MELTTDKDAAGPLLEIEGSLLVPSISLVVSTWGSELRRELDMQPCPHSSRRLHWVQATVDPWSVSSKPQFQSYAIRPVTVNSTSFGLAAYNKGPSDT